MTIIPSPEQVVQAHRSLLRLVVEALRRGTVHAQEYADWRDEPLDRSLAPALVRKGARRYLIEKDQDVQNVEEFEYEPEFLANLGLAVTADGVQIRVLRSAYGNQLPVPGHSQARRDFYTQPGLPFDDDCQATEATTAPVLRLVLHWSTDDEYNLDKVYLGCPKAGDMTRASVAAHWDWPIWRRHGMIIDGQVQAEVKDHDIYLDVEATGSEE